MLNQDPVKIPEIPGKITCVTIDKKEYIRYLAGRKYNAEKKYSEAEWVAIGRKCEEEPGLMYPNDNYEKYFADGETGAGEAEMTAGEAAFLRRHQTLELYGSFFEALYHEIKQQTRKRPESPVNAYQAESVNKVLGPLREMMKDEAYAGLLGLIETGAEEEGGMSYSDAMILMTQYKSALAKYRRAGA